MPTAHKPIEIFRPGRHITAQGKELDFSEQELAAAAAAYDPSVHEAPIVLGHPRHDKPAYGWVESLAFEGGRLRATPKQVHADFAEAVRAGAYKKVSARFYMPNAPHNPKPGAYYLKHVGFLGAQPPSVKGLQDPEFAEGDQVEGEVEFSESIEDAWSWGRVARLFRGMRDFIIGEKGVEVADQILPAWDVAEVESDAVRKAEHASNSMASFAEGDTGEGGADASVPAPAVRIEQAATAPVTGSDAPGAGEASFAERQAELDEARAENDRLRSELKRREDDERRSGLADFAEGLVRAGKLRPRDKADIVNLLDALPDSGEVEFSEGDEGKTHDARARMKAFLETLEPVADFREWAGGDGPTVDFSEPAELAREIQNVVDAESQAGRRITHAEALAHVKRKYSR